MKNKLIVLIGLMLIFNCGSKRNKDHKKFTIIDFSQQRIDTLKPVQNKTYYGYYVKIKGYSDDSIKLQRKGYYEIILSGKIDTLINGDYYGTEEIIWIFDPFKAKEGKLEIEYSL